MGFSWRNNLAPGLGLAALLAADACLGVQLGWPLALALLLAACGWGAAVYFRSQASRVAAAPPPAAERLPAPEDARKPEGRMQALLELNSSLARASADLLDERQLMDAALKAIARLTGALGCSFVPVDEWQQPLPAITYGQLPAPVLSAWSAHLASGMLRERCGACEVLHSNPGGCPLHPREIGAGMIVHCLHMHLPEKGGDTPGQATRPERSLGVLHLYLPPGAAFDDGDREFIASLLPEISMAYEAARMRAQEVTTMRQLRMLRAPENDFSASLAGLMQGLAQALEADFVILRLRPSTDDRLSNLTITYGDAPSGEEPGEAALNAVLAGGTPASPSETLPVWLALPLLLPEGPSLAAERGGRVLGMLAVGANRPFVFHPRQQAILQTIAAQAALLVENERMLHSLEYKVVIEERARLAREIHDGLAQTLAFLKLQSAQMQSYLAQGDITRLSAVLKDNYQALAEAYLDTRQAIDNLRLTPQEGLETWVERILREFETGAGVRVERALAPLQRELTPEVQAQLIRIVQEALSNVRKHARATYARVSLREWSGELILEVTDNGLGFDAGDVPEISRHGLRGMRERAEMIGADFQIVSQPHRGTTVRLVLPAWLEEETSS